MPAAGFVVVFMAAGGIMRPMSPDVRLRKPPRLRAGDRVRLVAPASPFAGGPFNSGCRVLRRLGIEPLVEREEFSREGFLAGNDRSRVFRLVGALQERQSSAAWCIRGGYGSARLLDLLRPEPAGYHAKVLVGFSDATALLLAFSRPGGFVTFHGPVVTQLGRLPRGALQWLRRLLFDPRVPGRVPLGRLKTLVGGRTRGFLYGGNLSILASLVGTEFLPSLAGAILFIEDTGEQAYRLDRLLLQLRSSGALQNVLGVVVGDLHGCRPGGRGRYAARAVVERAVAELGVPAVSGASFGHLARNLALPLGVLAELDADRGRLEILEAVVS